MTLFDWIVIAVIALLLFLAIRSSKKNACSGSCGTCTTGCASHKPGEVPDFVTRYRKDHPKSTHS